MTARKVNMLYCLIILWRLGRWICYTASLFYGDQEGEYVILPHYSMAAGKVNMLYGLIILWRLGRWICYTASLFYDCQEGEYVILPHYSMTTRKVNMLYCLIIMRHTSPLPSLLLKYPSKGTKNYPRQFSPPKWPINPGTTRPFIIPSRLFCYHRADITVWRVPFYLRWDAGICCDRLNLAVPVPSILYFLVAAYFIIHTFLTTDATSIINVIPPVTTMINYMCVKW